MVNDGVATTGELDESIIYGPGLALGGDGHQPDLSPGGRRDRHAPHAAQFGPALKWPWTKLEAPELTEQLIDRMVEGTQEQAAGRSIRELERLRDDYLVAIQQVLRQFDIGAGSTLRALEERLYQDAGARADARRGAGERLPRYETVGAAGVGRLQRPHVRFPLRPRVRRGHGRAVPPGGHRRGLPQGGPDVLHGREPCQAPRRGQGGRAAVRRPRRCSRSTTSACTCFTGCTAAATTH